MSPNITLSVATRHNLLSLQDTASLLSTTQTRLSTGKKVNSALDSPVNYFTSQSLSARSLRGRQASIESESRVHTKGGEQGWVGGGLDHRCSGPNAPSRIRKDRYRIRRRLLAQ